MSECKPATNNLQQQTAVLSLFAKTPSNVIDLMLDQKEVKQKGGTMRLGSYPCILGRKTRSLAAYRDQFITERHRHRYEVNNAFREILTNNGLVLSGLSPDGKLVEMIEIPGHPFFIGGQFHPELKSRLVAPHPLFKAFVKAAVDHRDAATRAKGKKDAARAEEKTRISDEKDAKEVEKKERTSKSSRSRASRKVKDDLPEVNGNGHEETAEAVPAPAEDVAVEVESQV